MPSSNPARKGSMARSGAHAARPTSRRLAFYPLHRWPAYLRRTIVSFWRNNDMGVSGMIAFFGFLSLVPLVILLLAVAGTAPGGVVTSRDIRHLLQGIVPGLSNEQFLRTYWEPIRHSRVTTRVLGVISLFVGAMGLHDSVDYAVNRIWRSPRDRSFWIKKVRGLAVILWVAAFALVLVPLTWIWATALGPLHIGTPIIVGWLALVPLLILDVAAFSALYILTPTVKVQVGPAIGAAAVAALLWEASKVIFGWWVLHLSTYNRVYGPLAAVVIVMLWLWISAMIFLFGVELNAIRQRAVSEP